MLHLGEMQILAQEMDRTKVDICGLSEIGWEDQGHFHTLRGHMVIYSGNKKQVSHGVAVWMHKKMSEAIISYEPINERIMVVRVYAKLTNVTLIQVYVPRAAAKEEVVRVFYEDLKPVIENIRKTDITIIMEDFNAKVGKQDIIGSVIGLYGLGNANDAGST